MRSTSPYLDTSFSFDSPGSLADAGVLDSGKAQIMGRATGHYRAQTVHAGLQYFDCNLQFPEPLQIDKLLPQSLCIVHVFDGAWQHKVDGTLNHYAPGHLHLLGLGESLEAQDQLPADSHARMAGVRIAGDYLHELARDDAQLLPLLALTADGMRFDQLPQCPAVSRLLQQLYLSPYTGGLRRLHCESLSVAVVLELAREGMSMLIVTHEMEFAAKVADRIIFMDQGYIIEESTPDKFFTKPESGRAQQFLSGMDYSI